MNVVSQLCKFQRNLKCVSLWKDPPRITACRIFSSNSDKLSETGKQKETEEAVSGEESITFRKQYFQSRAATISELKQKSGIDPYPHKFHVTRTLPDYIHQHGHLDNGESLPDVTESVAGRIFAIRAAKKLCFVDLRGDGMKLQVKVYEKSFSTPDEYAFYINTLRRGDIVGVEGTPSRTKRGELSIDSKKLTLLAPCLHIIPTMYYGLKDQESRYRQRYLDLMFTEKVRQIFETRTKAIAYIRRYFDQRNFLEVETPVLNAVVGGASAKPFVTLHNQLHMDMYMRVAPELNLKMLVVGGLDRVYEIGRQFRNEGINATHNPEFTTCEFYMAYADCTDVIAMTEELLSGLVRSIHGTHKIKYHPNGTDGPDAAEHELDFTPPFRRIKMIPALEEALNVKLPDPTDFHTAESNRFFDNLCTRHEVPCEAPRTTTRLLDKLVEKYLESQCVSPTLICDIPQIMSPLAKAHRSVPGLTERFELFVMQKELCNAYTELNDPVVQRQQFQLQAADREAGDHEAQPIDENFCTALEYGLPPTAGWGMGVDRLVMFLTDTNRIKEVLLFPTMKPKWKVTETDSENSDTDR